MRLPSMARRRVLAAPFFLLLITLAGCASVSHRGDGQGQMTQNDRLYPGRSGRSHDYADLIELMIDTAPETGILKLFAASPRMQNRDDEAGVALYEAAIQASRYVRTAGAVKFRWASAGGQTVYLRDVKIFEDDSLIMSMLENLQIVSTYQNEEGTYIIAEMAADIEPLRPSVAAVGGSVPEWIINTPEIPGYYVAVGSTRRQRLLTSSIDQADKNALSELIMQMLVSVYTQEDRVTTDNGFKSLQSSVQEASGVVEGYVVVSRWITPKGDDYYTLAICPMK